VFAQRSGGNADRSEQTGRPAPFGLQRHKLICIESDLTCLTRANRHAAEMWNEKWANSPLSIILSINAGGTGWTASNCTDHVAGRSVPNGSRTTRRSAWGGLAVSPIRPLSHLSSRSFAV
jgi:hypothetical protein